MSNPSAGLGPDLGPGGVPVSLRVCGIAVLIGVVVAVRLPGDKIACALHRTVGALHPIGQDHLGSVDLQQSFSFRTSIGRKAYGDANAGRGSSMAYAIPVLPL